MDSKSCKELLNDEDACEKLFNKDKYKKKREDLELEVLSIENRDLYGLHKLLLMTKIQTAPKITKKEQYVFIREEEWFTFMISLDRFITE